MSPSASRRRRSRRAAVTVWLVLAMGVIVAIVALGMDGGRMMDERRHAQAAADAAALAAAADLYANYPSGQGADPAGTAQQAALSTAAVNGYANDGTRSVVSVNIPPQAGAFQGQKDYVEVVIQSTLPAGFSAVFCGANLTVQARAVARGRPLKIGILALDPTRTGALTLGGQASVNVVNAGVTVNSSDFAALQELGVGTLSALSLDVTGGYVGVFRPNAGGPVRTGLPPAPDPVGPLAPPDPANYPLQSSQQLTVSVDESNAVLQPGVYRGGICIVGEGNVTLQPGVYILDGGGFYVAGEDFDDELNVVAQGVLLYNAGLSGPAGPIQINGVTANLNMTAPTDGPYRGISVFQDRGVTQPIQAVGSFQIAGLVYAPQADVQLTLTLPGDSLVGGVVSNTLAVSGTRTLTVNQGSNLPKVPDVRLVE
jgi:hypothetical protein